MRLISSKKTKRKIALTFVFALMLSNLLMLAGPQKASAVLTVTSPAAGTCFQHSGTVANGSLVTVYNIGAIQFTLTAAEISPGPDAAPAVGATTGVAQATGAGGDIDDDGDVIGNIFTIVPPTGTNFVVVPGFQNPATNASNRLAAANVTISNAISQDSSAGGADGQLGIDVGVITSGMAGVGRAIVAIARDADTNSMNAGAETYPKSGTGNNTVSISINGLGIAVRPSGEGSLTGTLSATLDGTPPSGIGMSGGVDTNNNNVAVANAIPGISSNTINLCNVSSAAGQVEVISDKDDDANELYDKSGAVQANILALGSIGTNTRVFATDSFTSAAGLNATSWVDLEPVIIKGKNNDQVIGTGSLTTDLAAAQIPAANATQVDTATTFGNSISAPFTLAFTDDNASATTTLLATSINITQTTPGAAPAARGFGGVQSQREGFLGVLRAALHDSAMDATNTVFNSGASWGVGATDGNGALAIVEGNLASADNMALGGFGGINGVMTTEPFNNAFVDLRINCDMATDPVAGWFAIYNSSAVAPAAPAAANMQSISATQSGAKFTNDGTTLFTQNVTNIAGSNPANARSLDLAEFSGTDITTTKGNAILYGVCQNSALTVLPILNGLDGVEDRIAVTPLLSVTNITNQTTSDVNLLAQVSGNNLSGTTTLTLASLLGVPVSGQQSPFVKTEGAALAENAQLGVDCDSGQSSVVVQGLATGSVDANVTSACTGGMVAPAPVFWAGGAPETVSGTTPVDASPAIQGEGRVIKIDETSVNGFEQLVNQIGGANTVNGVVIESQLSPTTCTFIDDLNDPNTASQNNAGGAGGNDVSRPTVISTNGIAVSSAAGGAGDAALTNATVLDPASGSTPAKYRHRITMVGGTADNAVTDTILQRFDAQDIFCPAGTTGTLSASVFAQNKINSPTLTALLGTAQLGTIMDAFTVQFGDDVLNSAKGVANTNSNIGATPRLEGGGVCTSNPLAIVENGPRAIPIGGRVSPRNLDPANSVLNNVVTSGELWIIPSDGAAFSTAPAETDISFSDDSLATNGAPTIVTNAMVNANAPFGTLVIPIKKNTATGAALPEASTTTVTVRNAQLTATTNNAADLVASVQFFNTDAGVVVNAGGVASANNATTPTVFTPYSPGSTSAGFQVDSGAVTVQVGGGTLTNSLLTSRLTTAATPQVNPFATNVSAVQAADANAITAAATKPDAASTDNEVTITGAAGSVDGGADIAVATTDGFDSVTVKSSADGSFVAKVKGDCSTATSVSVTITPSICGTAGTAATKTALCSGETEQSVEDVQAQIDADSDGTFTVAEVQTFVTAQGGLSAVISAGGNTLQAVINSLLSALGIA